MFFPFLDLIFVALNVINLLISCMLIIVRDCAHELNEKSEFLISVFLQFTMRECISKNLLRDLKLKGYTLGLTILFFTC